MQIFHSWPVADDLNLIFSCRHFFWHRTRGKKTVDLRQSSMFMPSPLFAQWKSETPKVVKIAPLESWQEEWMVKEDKN